VLQQIGPDKVLFGSQSPLFDQDLELHRVLWAQVDEQVKTRVLWDTAQRLFGTPRPDTDSQYK
jgi:predicted TIM-barrel fold metal-dependent hydrolase